MLSVRADGVLAEMELWWADPGDWRALLERAGFERITVYGWFDRRPLEPGGTDSVWVARRPATG